MPCKLSDMLFFSSVQRNETFMLVPGTHMWGMWKTDKYEMGRHFILRRINR